MSGFNLNKTTNVVKTALDRDHDELDSMRKKVIEECRIRIKTIKKEMVKLSQEEDRCERYLDSLVSVSVSGIKN